MRRLGAPDTGISVPPTSRRPHDALSRLPHPLPSRQAAARCCPPPDVHRSRLDSGSGPGDSSGHSAYAAFSDTVGSGRDRLPPVDPDRYTDTSIHDGSCARVRAVTGRGFVPDSTPLAPRSPPVARWSKSNERAVLSHSLAWARRWGGGRPIAPPPTVSPEFSTDRGCMDSDNCRHLGLFLARLHEGMNLISLFAGQLRRAAHVCSSYFGRGEKNTRSSHHASAENHKLSRVVLASFAPGNVGLIFKANSNVFLALLGSPFLKRAMPK